MADNPSMLASLIRRWPSGPGWRCGKHGHVIETSHLTLRQARPDDLQAIRNVMDAEFIQWNGYPSDDKRLLAMANAWIHDVRPKPYRESWLICDRHTNNVIGMRTVMSDEADSRICATANALAPGWRGRGLGSEELATFISLLKHLGFQHVVASTHANNYKGINLYTKLGFTRLPKSEFEHDTDSTWMGLTIPAHHRPCTLR